MDRMIINPLSESQRELVDRELTRLLFEADHDSDDREIVAFREIIAADCLKTIGQQPADLPDEVFAAVFEQRSMRFGGHLDALLAGDPLDDQQISALTTMLAVAIIAPQAARLNDDVREQLRDAENALAFAYNDACIQVVADQRPIMDVEIAQTGIIVLTHDELGLNARPQLRYTYGMYARRTPEVATVGLDEKVSKVLLACLSNFTKQHPNKPLTAGMQVDLPAVAATVALVDAPRSVVDVLRPVIERPLLQLIYPDHMGRLPGDHGFDPDLQLHQPFIIPLMR